MKKFLIVSGIAALALVSIAGAAGYAFNSNLTVGSTGADVVALQTFLGSNGFSIPSITSGAAQPGYFGSQTKAAVKLYQAANGVPNTGFVGPLTRAALNAGGGVAVAPATCPLGYTCTANTAPVVQCPVGYTCTSNTTGVVTGGSTGITTTGVPGIISVSQGPLSSIVSNVGQSMVPVLTVRVQAQYSDLSVQSLTLDLGNNTGVYNKIFNKIYVTDGTNVLASQLLNSSTVVQSGSDYIVGIAGFNLIVPKGTYKDVVIKVDSNSSIDSKYLSGGASYPTSVLTGYTGAPATGWGIAIPANGLRAVDGAGVNLYGPTTGFAQGLTINASLVDNAKLNLSLNSTNPDISFIPVSDTSNGQYNGLPVLTFDLNAQNDAVHLRTVVVGIGAPAGTGSVSAAYLYQGSTQVSSASVSSGLATFSNILNGTNGATIGKDQTLPYTVKVDVTGVTTGSLTITATTTSSGITALNTGDGTVTVSGSATGKAQTVSNSGPLFVLASAPTLDLPVDITPGGSATNTLFRYTGHYSINVTSVGTSTNLGLPSDPMGGAFGSSTATVLVDGTASTTLAISPAYVKPSNSTLNGSTNFTIAQNQTVNIPVTYTFTVVNPGSASFMIQQSSIKYSIGTAVATTTATFMASQTAWQTNSR